MAASASCRTRLSPEAALASLGLSPNTGASDADVRRAYLRRARETHPDKGGSADEFLQVIRAFEVLSGDAAPDVAGLAGAAEGASSDLARGTSSYTRFSLAEVNELAAQLRELHLQKSRGERQQKAEQRSGREQRRQKSESAAELVREKEAADRLDRALRQQRRLSLPEGVEMCAGRSRGSTLTCSFRAQVCLEGTCHSGPQRESIEAAESDLRRMQRVHMRFGDEGVAKLRRQLEKSSSDRPKQAWR
eukprot:gnl/TRDRNA2_/TRDRNA2_81795_c0_seq2.p1 gnl/TRDRNA2_/TRDRNA2_81795_c0~~gnl/TRDRNA2_/TRDRNA2_81795_c0_seq2.p1  ORF type:complete len:257 (-),score=46.36 gnl/TRDRNA2_/TRDRNA2_81795_c0_seq2:99-842(-)